MNSFQYIYQNKLIISQISNGFLQFSRKTSALKSHKYVVERQRDIYCRGDLLHQVQMLHIYPDSKTYVDKKLKFDAEQVLSNFDSLKKTKQILTRDDMESFMEENFEEEHGFEEHIPPDWGPYPEFINQIQNPHMQQFALDVHSLWRTLGRRINEDVRANFSRYSLLYTPKPFIIPGGRFREFYYWDSYWIIKGLLLSEMFETARNMIENYLYLVEEFGLIPNGGRIYYTDRSQPPLLSKMVESYVRVTHDLEFLLSSIPILEKEYFFWVNTRMIQVVKGASRYNMFHYGSADSTPRPESYREDYEFGLKLPESERGRFYNEVRAAAESGIDFSGRWWIPTWKDHPPFTDINTSSIIPVDLNSIMQMNSKILAKFYRTIGVKFKYEYFAQQAINLRDAIMDVLWHDDIGAWLDYDYKNQIRRDKFYPSNLAPLWAGAYPKEDAKHIAKKVIRYLQEINILSYDGGIPASIEITGQQWDYPNAWAPHQDILISGLMRLENKTARRLGRQLAENWIGHNYITFKQDHVMYEKYNASMIFTGGGGGEYENQTGFGWTNGVLLAFLHSFYDYNFKEDF